MTETRTRGNDIHLPISLAYASRLCDAHPEADRELIMVSVLLHDTGWAHVDESRIISEGFSGDWRKAAIRYEHEVEGCKVARRVLPPLGYSPTSLSGCARSSTATTPGPWHTPWRMH
ncbi:HD domain-containing protein [Arthrobacter alpinus]|nr:HD domain-containing protein [Arthrobacter alpinus]